MKIAVIGSGITGSSAARALVDAGCSVTVYEQSSVTGGLVHCRVFDQNLFHVVGGHVFYSRNQKVNQWFWQHFDLNLNSHPLNVMLVSI